MELQQSNGTTHDSRELILPLQEHSIPSVPLAQYARLTTSNSWPNREAVVFYIENQRYRTEENIASWEMRPYLDGSPGLILRAIARPLETVLPKQRHCESKNNFKERCFNEGAKHDGTHGYWLTEYFKGQLLDPDAALTKSLKSLEGKPLHVALQTVGFSQSVTNLYLKEYTPEELCDMLTQYQRGCALIASDGRYVIEQIEITSLKRDGSVLHRDQDQGLGVRMLYGKDRFYNAGPLLEPLTGACIGHVVPQCSLTGDGKNLLIHYSEPWYPQPVSIEEVNEQVKAYFAKLIVPSKAAPMPKEAPRNYTEERLNALVEHECEDASYLVDAPHLIPKIIDNGEKLSWPQADLACVMVSKPKEIPVYAYRTVVVEEGTLKFRFCKTPSEAAKNLATESEIAECSKTPQQKKLQEYARGKQIDDLQKLFERMSMDQEKNPKLNHFKKTVSIPKLNIAWDKTQDEFQSKQFATQVRAVVSSDKAIQDLIKYAGTLEDTVSKLKSFEQMGDSMMNEVLLIQRLLSVASLLLTEPLSSLATVQRKLQKSFDYQVKKAGSCQTLLPFMMELWETRVCHAFPELSDESGALLCATR
jgi:hypothetical protein